MNIERANSDALVVNKLPDGSRVIIDPTNQTVFALNATAGAASDACGDSTTLAAVTESMQRSLDPQVNEALAQEAIQQLQDKNLLSASGLPAQASRRRFLATLGAAAVPLVVSLTIADQRAHAVYAASKPTTAPCASVNPTCKP